MPILAQLLSLRNGHFKVRPLAQEYISVEVDWILQIIEFPMLLTLLYGKSQGFRGFNHQILKIIICSSFAQFK